MAELVSQQVQDYLDALKTALKLSPGQSDGIVSEVRADLFDHVHRLVDQGRDEPAAVAEAWQTWARQTNLPGGFVWKCPLGMGQSCVVCACC